MKYLILVFSLLFVGSSLAEPVVYPLGFTYYKNKPEFSKTPSSGTLIYAIRMIGETLYDVDRDATLESLKVTVGDREIPSDNLSFSKPPSVIDAGARFELSIKDLDSVKSKPIRIEGIVHYYVDSKISSDSEQTVTLELGKTFSIGTWVFSIIEIDKNTVTFNINKHPDRMPSINFFTTEKTKIEAHLYSRSTTVINGEASYSVKYEFKDVHSELIVRGSTIELPKESQKAKFAFDFVTPY